MIYAYIRVSTEQQNLTNQQHEIELFAIRNNITIGRWVEEVISSRRPLHERQLGQILRKLRRGDIIVTTEISRLGRNLLEVMGILQKALEKKCQIWTIKENYRLGADIQSKILAFAFGLASEIERQLISERTRNSLQRLKNEGKHLGRPYGKSYKKLKRVHGKIKKLLKMKVSKAEIAREVGCSWVTLHRYLQRNQD